MQAQEKQTLPQSPRIPYNKPNLARYGQLGSLTQGGSSTAAGEGLSGFLPSAG